MKREHSAGIIPVWIKGDRVQFLLLKSKRYGHWMFPKGRSEAGEDDRATARRELFEETGIEDICLVNDAVFIEKWFMNREGQEIAKDVKYFLGIVTGGAVRPQLEEVAEYRWATIEEAQKFVTHRSRVETLKQALRILQQEQLID